MDGIQTSVQRSEQRRCIIHGVQSVVAGVLARFSDTVNIISGMQLHRFQLGDGCSCETHLLALYIIQAASPCVYCHFQASDNFDLATSFETKAEGAARR
jgi:hypothetical protein